MELLTIIHSIYLQIFLVVVVALKWSDYISHNAEQFHVQIFFLFKTHHNKIIIKFHSHRVPVGEGYRCTQWRCAMYSLWSLVWLFGWLFDEIEGKRLNIKIRSLKIPFTLCSNRYKNIDNFFFVKPSTGQPIYSFPCVVFFPRY